MRYYTKNRLMIVLAFASIMVSLALIDHYRPEWAYNNPPQPYTKFECIKHNFTQLVMEPMTRYICWENQTCYTFTDVNCNGLFVVLTECLVSQAAVDNQTIMCNGTVEDCEHYYNYGGGRLDDGKEK